MILTFNPKSLPGAIEQGHIISQVHPTLPLRIYNYTAKTQYDREWNPMTLSCRGLVLDTSDNIIARPLPKFFNLSEHQGNLPTGVPKIYEKLDGSLIILFYYGDRWVVASRGSFNSEQSQKAAQLLTNYYEYLTNLDRDCTYLFEIIYPFNRIVVDYGTAERLVLLAGVDTQTGIELDFETIDWPDRAVIYPATDLPQWIAQIEANSDKFDNSEGFILKWDNGFRLKYKLTEYVRLHRIITQVSAKDIWACLSEERDLNEFLDLVPDEFYHWVKDIKSDLEQKYQAIESECQRVFKSLATRKETAAYFQTQKYPGVLFLMLDNRDYRPTIWRSIKPDYQRPFRNDFDR
jgi:T4 RnlA family RNA ligase